MPGPVFGHVPDYPVGSRFGSRAELADAGVHRHREAGISGSASEGAGDLVLALLPHLLAYEILEERVYPGSGFNGQRFSKYCRALSSRSS